MFTPLPSTKSNVSSGQGKGLVLSPNVSPVSGASASTLPSSYTLCGNQSQDSSPPLAPGCAYLAHHLEVEAALRERSQPGQCLLH